MDAEQTTITHTLNRTGKTILSAAGRSPYDSEAIGIMKDRQYLARVLRECTTEFCDMSIEAIMPCIEPPQVGVVPVEPGLTSLSIRGDSAESKVIGEGVVTYDIRFRAVAPGHAGISIRLLFDVELQQKEDPGYDIVSRGILYGGRMLSEQMGREVMHGDYGTMQKVYSIWICMNCALKRANTISRYAIAHEAIHGEFTDVARSDLLQVIVIRLSGETHKGKPRNKPTELMRLLDVTFSKRMDARDKLDAISGMGVRVTRELERRVSTMCNLSQGLVEEGRREGRAEGRAEGRREGRAEGESRLASLISQLISLGRNDDVARAAGDASYRAELFREFGMR